MKILKLQQGSPEWREVRKTTHNASEAPAVKGVSTYKSYSELVKEKATGITEEITPEMQRRFDKGHEAEAAARPILEEIIGDSLYPMTATDDEGYLLASSDGATLPPKGGTGFEHKLWNTKLASIVERGEVPESHAWQLDQQIAVFGFKKIIFVVSDGTRDNFVSCEYRSTPERIASLMAGWKQFDEDVANYKPEAVEQKPILTAKGFDNLPALMIEISGHVTASNLVEFKGHATAVIAAINTNLQTDQDFVDAVEASKYLKNVEDNAKQAKKNALSQTASIDALFKALDDVIKMSSDVRKDLDKKIAQEKDSRKTEMVMSAKGELADHVRKLNTRVGGFMQEVQADFAAAIKGLSSIDSMRSNIASTMAQAKIDANEIADRIEMNLKTLGDQSFLFPDLQAVCTKSAEDFAALLFQRQAAHKEAEDKKVAARVEQELAAKVAEQLVIEAANKRHAEAVERTKQAAVIADSAPVQMQASSSACGSLQPAISAKQQASQEVQRGRINSEFEIRDQIIEATLDMSVDEMKIVLHCCERVITGRQSEGLVTPMDRAGVRKVLASA